MNEYSSPSDLFLLVIILQLVAPTVIHIEALSSLDAVGYTYGYLYFIRLRNSWLYLRLFILKPRQTGHRPKDRFRQSQIDFDKHICVLGLDF